MAPFKPIGTVLAAGLVLVAPACAQVKALRSGGYSSFPITIDQGQENYVPNISKAAHVRYLKNHDTAPYKQGDHFSCVRFFEFHIVDIGDLRQADRNGNSHIDGQTELCLMKHAREGRLGGHRLRFHGCNGREMMEA